MKNILLIMAMMLVACTSNPTKKPVVVIPDTEILPSNFEHKSSLAWVQRTSVIADCVLSSKEFESAMKLVSSFDMSDDTGEQVLKKMKSVKAVLSTYRTKNPLSKAIAYRNKGKNVVYFNTRRNPRAMGKMVNTSCHELSHVADYGHGNNSSRGKENTVPYKVGKICENVYMACVR